MDSPPVFRRLSELERWVPTALFVGVAVALLLVVLMLRALLTTVAAGSDPVPAPIVAQSAPQVVDPAPPEPPRPQIRFAVRPLEASYTVVAGDTLSAIALRYNTTTAALRGINNLADDAILSVGQRLILP